MEVAHRWHKTYELGELKPGAFHSSYCFNDFQFLFSLCLLVFWRGPIFLILLKYLRP